jgi:hypothetical protein
MGQLASTAHKHVDSLLTKKSEEATYFEIDIKWLGLWPQAHLVASSWLVAGLDGLDVLGDRLEDGGPVF